jgi:hypothetical protein
MTTNACPGPFRRTRRGVQLGAPGHRPVSITVVDGYGVNRLPSATLLRS